MWEGTERSTFPFQPLQGIKSRSSIIVKVATALNSVIIIPFTLLICTYCSGGKIGKNEVGGACSAYGGEERRVQGFGGVT